VTVFTIEKLARYHAVDSFDCGQESLNRFLIRFALTSQQANASQTYVGLADSNVIGFYTLVVSEVSHDAAPERLKKGMARHPLPLMLLARLAVSRAWKGKGVGAGLLKNAMLRTLQAAEIGGIRALAAHAKDDTARSFYQHFGFIQSPTDPLHLFVLTKELKNIADSFAMKGLEADIKTDVQSLKGCISYKGPTKTLQDIEDAIAAEVTEKVSGAAQVVFAKLAPADVVLSEELIRERREEAKREPDD
jgi:GNAT superfamily N-acetyltransferase